MNPMSFVKLGRVGRALAVAILLGMGCECARAGSKRPDVADVVPLNQIAPHQREAVSEVIRGFSFHKRSQPETFPANPRVYLRLLNEPTLTLGLWQDLGQTPARLEPIGPGRYRGSDGSGTSAVWEYVLRSPRLHVLFCDLDYVSPHGAARLSGRIVLVVRSGYFQEVNGDPWIQQEIELFVKVDSRGWKTVAAGLRPVIEKIIDDQVQEAGWFVSLMSRLVEMYPDWATSVTQRQATVPNEERTAFLEVLKATRRPGAFTGRPVVLDAQATRASLPGTQRR
jgi:hypothetical protein